MSVSVWFGFVLRRRELRKVASLLLTNDVYIYIYIKSGTTTPACRGFCFIYPLHPTTFTKLTLFFSAYLRYHTLLSRHQPIQCYLLFLFFSFLFFFFSFFYWKTKIVDPNPSNFVTKTILLCHCLLIFRRFRV